LNSTQKGDVPPYLGIDLTDRYAVECRPIDVCGLKPTENGDLISSFWHWEWDPGGMPLNIEAIEAIVEELKASKAAMLDGPQGLATPGNALRGCESQSGAAGKTPDVRPRPGSPFAGFICSSLDLFAALERARVRISPPRFLHGACEVYPGHIWRILAGRVLPKKGSDEGRRARKRILEALRVSGLPKLPTHDQNDACVAAILAAAADGAIPGITPVAIGVPLTFDDGGALREGPMVIPKVSTGIRKLISNALFRTLTGLDEVRPSKKRAATSTDPQDLAEDLLTCFVDKGSKGNPMICTYSWAYRYLFHASYTTWAQAYAGQVIEIAKRTRLQELPGLGAVCLDTFVVSKRSRLPSDGHWPTAHYEREDWERALGMATVLD
jgi:hypothetical protein